MPRRSVEGITIGAGTAAGVMDLLHGELGLALPLERPALDDVLGPGCQVALEVTETFFEPQ